ncbi:MAG: hypothetical protein DME53_00240 [Verrucomicrobia bacterium]|nr:MAG: hypothetical protein DME53_00240 [Verrucomicrobiota bacterium]
MEGARGRSPRTERCAHQREARGLRSVQDIVAASGVKPNRVPLSIEQFISSGDHLSLSYLLEEVPDAQEIRSTFEEIGIERLKPVSEFFHGRISLTTLRLVRCVIVAEAAA